MSENEPSTNVPRLRTRRGGQPGNHNALKHGLYLHRDTPLNPSAAERARLSDVREFIEQLKTYMHNLYISGIDSEDPDEIMQILSSLTQATMALTRLINTQGWNHPPIDAESLRLLDRQLADSSFPPPQDPQP
jgi:2-hydroxychromene-2-carboxylate isomerase